MGLSGSTPPLQGGRSLPGSTVGLEGAEGDPARQRRDGFQPRAAPWGSGLTGWKACSTNYPNRLAFGLYLLISVLFFGLRVIGSPTTAHVGFTSDAAMMMWYLVWWPFAIRHWLNPFITHAVWPIGGYNLTWATSMPAVAIAFTLVTVLFGPVVSYNFAALIAPALSAWAAFALCRNLTGTFAASLMGGFVYGFSPYEMAHVYGCHLPLTFNFVPPLCVLAVLRLIRAFPEVVAAPENRQRDHAHPFLFLTGFLARAGLSNGSALIPRLRSRKDASFARDDSQGAATQRESRQCLTSGREGRGRLGLMVFRKGDRASILVWTIALALLLVLQCLISTEVLATMSVFGTAALLCAFLLMPAKRGRVAAVALSIAVAYAVAAILLAPFLYPAFIAGTPPKDAIFPASFFSADLLSFIIPGPLMLLLPKGAATLVAHAATVWEEGCYLGPPLIVILLAYFWTHSREPLGRLLAVMFLLAAGAALGPVLHVGGRVIMRLPWAVADTLPLIRQALPVRFASYAFFALAIVVSLWFCQETARLKKLAAASLVLAFLPNPGLMFYKSTFDTPAFFAEGLYRRYLHSGENVLIVPYGRNGASMAWQAQSWMYFRMPGGHLSTTPQQFRRWPVVNTLETGLPLPNVAAQFRAFAIANKIDAIVVVDGTHGSEGELPGSLGIKPLSVGGVSLYRLIPALLHQGNPASLAELQSAATEYWFAQLLCASHLFISRGGKLASLNPARAHEWGLLPDSKWSDNLEMVFVGAPHGASNGLWIGPGADGTLSAGLFTTPAAAAALVLQYEAPAVNVLYPYPRPYANAPADDDSMHFLLMSLRPEILNKSCSPVPIERSESDSGAVE
jgi:hypothetical protein